MRMHTVAAAALLALTSSPAAAQDRTTYSAGSRPRVLINWRSFEANGFRAAWKDPITNVVINAYTHLNLTLGVEVRGFPQGALTIWEAKAAFKMRSARVDSPQARLLGCDWPR
jgi:hypothetical protein